MSSSSSVQRSDSPLSPLDDADFSSATSQMSGAEPFSRRIHSHDSDASASEALLSLRMEARTHATVLMSESEDRRASWQRLPNVSVVPRLRRKLGNAYANGDSAIFDARTKAEAAAAPASSSDEDEDMPYSAPADDVISSVSGSSRAPSAAAHSPRPRRKQPLTSKALASLQGNPIEPTEKTVSPKVRRKFIQTHSSSSPSSSSAGAESQLTDESAARVRLPPPHNSVDRGEDVVHVEFNAAMTSMGSPPQGRRHRHVPDSMQHIACYFCRRRKIKCGPPAGSDKSCPPCAKRQLPCEYAEKSNRGMRTDLIRKKQSQAVISPEDSSA